MRRSSRPATGMILPAKSRGSTTTRSPSSPAVPLPIPPVSEGCKVICATPWLSAAVAPLANRTSPGVQRVEPPGGGIRPGAERLGERSVSGTSPDGVSTPGEMFSGPVPGTAGSSGARPDGKSGRAGPGEAGRGSSCQHGRARQGRVKPRCGAAAAPSCSSSSAMRYFKSLISQFLLVVVALQIGDRGIVAAPRQNESQQGENGGFADSHKALAILALSRHPCRTAPLTPRYDAPRGNERTTLPSALPCARSRGRSVRIPAPLRPT